MFGLGPAELLLIFMIILVLFGSTRIPQLLGGIGEGISNFKRGLASGKEALEAPEDENK